MNENSLKKAELASLDWAPLLPSESWNADVYERMYTRRKAFVAGAEWQGKQLIPDLKFMLDALPVEASIADPKLRAEIGLVRNKINEIISKIQIDL